METTTNEAKPVERWADRIRLLDANAACQADVSGERIGPLPEQFRVKDLLKTAEEIAVIGEVTAALNDFRRIVCGLPALTFAPERVHLLAADAFDVNGAPGRFQGKAWLGHVYLGRGWPLWLFQALLAHEMFHAMSYLWVDFCPQGATTDLGLKLPYAVLRRGGMLLIDPSYGTMLPHFHGLNEGVTETAVTVICRMMAAKTKLHSEEDKRKLAGFVNSLPLVSFVDKLVEIVSSPAPDTMDAFRTLLLDNFNGTDEFLKRLEPRLPGATERLRRTGARPEDELIPAAEDLGLADLADDIRRQMALDGA